MPDFFTILKEIGLPLALVVYYVWKEQKRDSHEKERTQRQEDFIQKELVTLLRDNTQTIGANNSLLKRVISVVDKRPCIQGKLEEVLKNEQD